MTSGVPVVLSDLDAIWVGDPLPALAAAGQGAAGANSRGFDLVLSRGFFPSVVHSRLKVAGEEQEEGRGAWVANTLAR